jgi:pyoluteorin transport system permease protein
VRFRGFSARRIGALVRKETRQIVRDPSSVLIGIVLPLALILIFGYGLSLDVRDAPLAIVTEETSAAANELASGFELSPYFDVVRVHTMAQAEELLLEHRVDGILRIPPDFARAVVQGGGEVQLLVHGVDANRARIIQGYSQGAVARWAARRAVEGRQLAAPAVEVTSRLWFNEANDSRHFIVPGLVVLVMTLIGSMLTALVMAREWERGTIEALFVTPARSAEILVAKMIPNFALGMIGLLLVLGAARILFHVPLRGSLVTLAGASSLYLLVTLAIGLVISSTVKNQFVASQLALLVTFMPAMMLSGFLYDLRSMPAAVRAVTYALPARYFVTLLQTIFLAGDLPSVLLPHAAMLLVMATVFLLLARRATAKRLE